MKNTMFNSPEYFNIDPSSLKHHSWGAVMVIKPKEISPG
jgi:hypothetical protein